MLRARPASTSLLRGLLCSSSSSSSSYSSNSSSNSNSNSRHSSSYSSSCFLSSKSSSRSSSLRSSPSVFSLQHRRFFSAQAPKSDSTVTLTFVESDGKEKAVKVPEGMTLLEAAHANDVPIEDDLFASLPEPSVEEEDMLDLAACLTDTSRLGCQVTVSKRFQGERIRLPPITRNFFVDGHKPSPH